MWGTGAGTRPNSNLSSFHIAEMEDGHAVPSSSISPLTAGKTNPPPTDTEFEPRQAAVDKLRRNHFVPGMGDLTEAQRRMDSRQWHAA